MLITIDKGYNVIDKKIDPYLREKNYKQKVNLPYANMKTKKLIADVKKCVNGVNFLKMHSLGRVKLCFQE